MGPLAYKQEERYTFGHYRNWTDDDRWELIDGVPYNMSPAPSPQHQLLLVQLVRQFSNYLDGKSCLAIPAPFDVRLPEDNEEDDQVMTVVQPDLSVICDRSKLDNAGDRGAPELVIEILSPGTFRKDQTTKFARYERAGVKEYWLVDPTERNVTVFFLDAVGSYGSPSVYSDTDCIKVGIFPDLEINVAAVFVELTPVPTL